MALALRRSAGTARSIKSLAVNKSPYSSEFGRPGKGRIEVTTRAGSLTRLHKRFEFAIRDASLDAHNHFISVNPPRRREWLARELDGPPFRRVQLFEHDWASRTAGLVERAQAALKDLQSVLGMPFRSPHLKGSTQPHETKMPPFNHPLCPGAVDS